MISHRQRGRDPSLAFSLHLVGNSSWHFFPPQVTRCTLRKDCRRGGTPSFGIFKWRVVHTHTHTQEQYQPKRRLSSLWPISEQREFLRRQRHHCRDYATTINLVKLVWNSCLFLSLCLNAMCSDDGNGDHDDDDDEEDGDDDHGKQCIIKRKKPMNNTNRHARRPIIDRYFYYYYYG